MLSKHIIVGHCLFRSAGHVGDGLFHGHDGAHVARRDVLRPPRPFTGESSAFPPGNSCPGMTASVHMIDIIYHICRCIYIFFLHSIMQLYI